VDEQIDKENKASESHKTVQVEREHELEKQKKRKGKLDKELKEIRDKESHLSREYGAILEEKKTIEDDIKVLESQKSGKQEKLNSLNKQIDDKKKSYKKMEYEAANLDSTNTQLDGILKKTYKMVEELKKECIAQNSKKKNLEDDAKINLDQILNKTTELEQTNQEITKISQ
jgi:chromosome segregation ATPase